VATNVIEAPNKLAKIVVNQPHKQFPFQGLSVLFVVFSDLWLIYCDFFVRHLNYIGRD